MIDADITEPKNESKETKKRQTQVDPSIQCLSSRKSCKRKRLKGFDFCHKHILEDKNSPFQQCSFIIKSTEERCLNPAPKVENKKTFCLIHTRDPKLKKAHDEIMRRNMKRKLAQCKAVAGAKRASSEAISADSQRSPHEPKRARDGDCDEFHALEVPESGCMYTLQDNGGKRYDVSWFGENDSDADSVDSEEEDPLRHAGVWTLEEALKVCRDKMIRKRSLYLEQYKRLHILLKKRKQCHLMRMATAGYHSGEDQELIGGTSMKLPEQRALGLYQHLNGTELLLERQGKEKRSRMNTNPKLTPQNRCSFLENMNRCENRVLPLSKFCLNHICSDPDQRLYRKCTFEENNSNLCCNTPILQVFRSTTCDLHAVPLPRYQSESLQNAINPIDSGTSDLVESKTETTPDDITTQLVAGDKEDEQNTMRGDLPLDNFDQNTAEEKKQEINKEKDSHNDTGKLCFDSKDPGGEKIDVTSDMAGCTEASGETLGTCSDKNAENRCSKITTNSEGSEVLIPRRATESPVEERKDRSTSKGELHDSTVTGDEVNDSTMFQKKQADPFVETHAKPKEVAEQNE